MAAAYAYLTRALMYQLPGQAVFNGQPVNQQLLLSSNASIQQALAFTEEHALYGSQECTSGHAHLSTAARTAALGFAGSLMVSMLLSILQCPCSVRIDRQPITMGKPLMHL